ncbi:hypothetical protein HanRHA438_Chr05g0214741 [Helianthus annuus]|nr:hypothetical protein HanRHA438_Chr05g0214741 [Helianthus annuus]
MHLRLWFESICWNRSEFFFSVSEIRREIVSSNLSRPPCCC